MLKTYVRIFFRNISKNKLDAFVNHIGIALGFAACLIIFLIISYEKSFDNFHAKKDSVYRLYRESRTNGSEQQTGVPFPVARQLRADFPQFKNVAAISSNEDVQVIVPNDQVALQRKFKESKVFLAEQNFFDLFDFKIIKGDPKNAITAPNTAVLTEKIAKKYFDVADRAMDKVIRINGRDIKITGIIKDIPINTDIPIGIVVSYTTMNRDFSDWVSISDNNICFVQLKEGVSGAQMEPLLSQFVTKYVPAEHAGYHLRLQPLLKMHFDSKLPPFSGRTFNRDLIVALTWIGFFLMIIACVNFVNLSTAKAVLRAREVGVRKVLGSSPTQLFLQFLAETASICITAVLIGLAIAMATIAPVSKMLGVSLSWHQMLTPSAAIFTLACLAMVIILAGCYPALVLTKFNVIRALKTKITEASGSAISLRRVLVVFQFVIAQAMIIGTLVVVGQMAYFQQADMGFDRTAVINVPFPHDSASRQKMDRIKNMVVQIPAVAGISLSNYAPNENDGWATDLRMASNKTNKIDLIVNMKPADTGYFSVYKMRILAGRTYLPTDTIREFVVNETLLKKLNLGSPQQAIGTSINVAQVTAPIVGVVRDFHLHSLKDPIDPVVMMPGKHFYTLANIRLTGIGMTRAIDQIRKIWDENFPDYVFDYSFLDQHIAALYEQENQLSKLYSIFAFIAIFISCLGLYGLINFMIVRKHKEIGVRKVLGAPVRTIVWLLSKELTMLIGIAFFVAGPVAFIFMHGWLEQYEYKIPLGAGYFVATLVISLLIGWCTMGYSTIRAAMSNPIKSLRTE